jgi:hypothetical protein
MPDAATMNRITAYVIGASALLVLAALFLGGVTMAFGATVGGVYAIVNWLAMRWLGNRLMVANDRGRMLWGSLLGAKMLIAMLVVWAILSTGAVDPIGFIIGLSGLVLGIVSGTFHTALGSGHSTREEA